MGTIRTSIYCFLDYSATLHDSFEVGYSVIKNGGKGRDYLPNTGTLDKSFFDEISYESFISLYEKLFDRASYSNLPIPRFGSEEVLVSSMGICKESSKDSQYKKVLYEDCFFEYSRVLNPPTKVFIKEVTCTKMVNTPIWMYVDKELLDASPRTGIFTLSISRENTPTMCLLILESVEESS